MRTIFFVLLLLSATTTFAQTDTLSAKELGEVIVTGQYKPQNARSSVYQVRVINQERIRKQGATKVQDVLNNELNIRFSQDLATGGSGITLNGMSGQNVKILVDGLPLSGRQGINNEIDINQIDINTIERIEIVEGPMSVLFGADALAGVINIITKKNSVKKFGINARIHEESIGGEYGFKQGIHNQSIGADFRFKNWTLGGNFGHNYFGGWKDTALERELVWHKKDQLLAGGYIGFNNGKLVLKYRIDGLDEIITNPGNFALTPDPDSGDTLAFDQEYLSRRTTHQLQGSYFVNKNLSFNAQSSYNDYSRQVFSTNVTKGSNDIRLSSTGQSIVDFNSFAFRTTALVRFSDNVSIQPGIDINTESGSGERMRSGINNVQDYAFFLTSEIKALKFLSFRPGVRFISNSVYDAPPVIPSLNAKIDLGSAFDIRLAYAKGFRAPSLREMYFNFFDANHQIIGNPDLKAETSNSFTASVNWRSAQGTSLKYGAVISAFYNDVENLIDFAPSVTNPNIYEYINTTESKTRGVAINGNLQSERFALTAGAAMTGFYNTYFKSMEGLEEIQWSPEINATVGYTIPSISLDLNLFYKFTGRRPGYGISNQNIVETRTEGFHMADITLTKKLPHGLRLNAGVRNLFDVDRVGSSIVTSGIHTPSGIRNIASGRSLFAALIFNFEK